MSLRCRIGKAQFVKLLIDHEYNPWSEAGLEAIYDWECMKQEDTCTLFDFDHPVLRGQYSEYESIKAAAKDLGLTVAELCDKYHILVTCTDSVIICQ